MSARAYERITERIVGMLEEGTVPWVKPWASAEGEGGLPRNGSTGKTYRGINIWLLSIAGLHYSSSEWFTYRQETKHGGQVRGGEKGSMFVFWKPSAPNCASAVSRIARYFWDVGGGDRLRPARTEAIPYCKLYRKKSTPDKE